MLINDKRYKDYDKNEIYLDIVNIIKIKKKYFSLNDL